MMQLLPPTVRISSAPQPDMQSLDQLTESLITIASDYPRFDLKENATQSLGNVTGDAKPELGVNPIISPTPAPNNIAKTTTTIE